MIVFEDFQLKELELINGGVEFKATYNKLHKTEALDYKTKHTLQEYNFNNCQPAYLMSLLNKHAARLNLHAQETIVTVKKIIIDQYGEAGDRQTVLKMDYEFTASSENPAKATTNKVLMEYEHYKQAEKVLEIIDEIIDNMYEFVINEKRFPAEEMSVEMKGNVLEVA